jgi:hypothetical protein
VLVTTPPIFDNYYAYIPKRPVGINTLHFGPDTRITLSVIDMTAVQVRMPLGAPVACGEQDAIRCLSESQY